MPDSIPLIPSDKPIGMSFEKALPWLKAGSYIRCGAFSYGEAWKLSPDGTQILTHYRTHPENGIGIIGGRTIEEIMRNDWEVARTMEDFKWDTP